MAINTGLFDWENLDSGRTAGLLKQAIAEAAEACRETEIHYVEDHGITKVIAGKKYYDENKPRAKHGSLAVEKRVSALALAHSGTDLEIEVLKQVGAQLGHVVYGKCASCQHFNTKMQKNIDHFRGDAVIMAKVGCKLGDGGVICPDQIHLHDPIMNYRQQYEQVWNGSQSPLSQPAFDVRPVPPPIKKEEVKVKEIEVELKKLDENYGIF